MPPNVAGAIELSADERAQLEAWTRRRTSAQALAQRSRIVLLAADGLKNTEIAEQLAINHRTATRPANHIPCDTSVNAPTPDLTNAPPSGQRTARRVRRRDVDLSKVWLITVVLLGLALLGTFSPFFELFAPEE
ncbi:MAG: hypothetical protein ACXVHJ_09860 [Solirubrobacteraceae bacterium]